MDLFSGRFFGPLLALAILFTGCAQPEPPGAHLSNYDNDFATNIGVIVDYVTDGDRTFVVVEIDNQPRNNIDVWMVHTIETADQEQTTKSRFYQGDQEHISQTFRVPRLGSGVKETISFVLMDQRGEELFRSTPIIYTQTEGKL